MATRSVSKGISRRGRGRSSLVGFVFLGLALIVSAWIFTQANRPVETKKAEPTIVAQYDTVNVPVPMEQVPAGTKVKDIDIKMVPYPKHQLPAGALESLASVREAVTTSMLPANLPIFRDNLSFQAQSGNPVIEQIPQGMRAITLRVDATSAVEGWASTGAIVDVLLVEKDRTSVIAEQVKILSAERVTKPMENNNTPNIPSTVTVLVTQQQALALATAVPRGKISFALRSKKDEENWNEKNFTPDKLHGRSLNTANRSKVKGFVSINTNDGSKKNFALTENGWVPSDKAPKGFAIDVKE